MDKYQQFQDHIRRKVRFYSAQQDGFQRSWKEGKITREEFMEKFRRFDEKIKVINDLCSTFHYDATLNKGD